MNIVFRVDSSIEIGTGHVMRCLTLADELKKQYSNILFICRDFDGHLKDLINEKGYSVVLLPDFKFFFKDSNDFSGYYNWLSSLWQQDANETINIINNNKLNWLIVDHYGIDYRWHNKLRDLTQRIMVIDDLADRKLDCDLLLDQTYGRKKQDYFELIPNDCQMLLGAKYALLRPEFALFRSRAIKKRKKSTSISNILITMGGMDINNVTSRVIKTLFSIKWYKKPSINVVLNGLAPHFDTVLKLAENPNLKVNIISNANNMAELMVKADLAIGASGSTSWERCSLGLPTLAICLAENQKDILRGLQKADAHLVIDNEDNDIFQSIVYQLEQIQKTPQILQSMSKRAFDICDANGVHWVDLNISPCIAKDGQKLNLQEALISDAKIIYEWQCHPETRKFSNNSEIPLLDDHLKWMKKKLDDLLSFFWIIIHRDVPSGVLRFDPIDLGEGEGYLISIFIDPKKHSLGIATGALEIGKRIFPKSKFYAKILPENNKSVSLFTRVGFRYRADLSYYELNLING